MKVIRYSKDDVEHYFDYDGVIHMLKENNGRALFHICKRIPTGDKQNKIKWETSDIEITAENLLLDDAFEIRYFPFTRNECLQIKLGNMTHEVSEKLGDYMREMQIIEFKTGRKM